MFYFKKVHFHHSDKANLESVFRKSAIRRDSLALLELSKSDIGSDKYFLGYENKKALYFLHIKSSVEFLLPNIIFYLPKDGSDFHYAFRLSRLAMILFFSLVIILFFSLLDAIKERELSEGLITSVIFLLLFSGLSWIELKLTQFRIRKLLQR